MLIEIFGLPGSGKSTLSRAWRAQGLIVVRNLSRTDLMLENLRFIPRHPLSTLQTLRAILRAPRRMRYTLFMNAFLVQNAKYMRAKRLSRSGKIVGIDQGHFQNILSILGDVSDARLQSFIRSLPRPDLLLVLDLPKEERAKRLGERAWKPRAEFGEAESERFLRTIEALYARTLPFLSACGVPHYVHKDGGQASLETILSSHLTYITSARMPTEKAHGVSIAHMCASFAKGAARVTLIVPTRRRKIDEDLWTYYSVPRIFEFKRFYSPDFLGRGFTHPIFFFAQRLAFACMARRRGVPWGTVYTREPEVARAFAGSHLVVFEAHNWPSGWRGKLQAWLVRRSALAVCNSVGTEAAARVHGLTRTLVAPNGFDPEQFSHAESKMVARERLELPNDAKIAMYVGALDDRKGVKTLFEASTMLGEGAITIIGGTKSELEIFSKKYPKVRFLGYRPYREIADNLAAADVLILPNTAASTESARYTSPIKLFAYMAAQRPIIAADVPATRAFLNAQNAILVPPDDPRALARKIEAVCSGESNMQNLVLGAKNDVGAYTWDARAKKVLDAVRFD